MEALDRSRTSSLEEVDSSEESEESLEQAAVVFEADLSSSPWVRKTKCFLLGRDGGPLFSSPNLCELCWNALGAGAR